MRAVSTSDLIRIPLNMSSEWIYLFESISEPIRVVASLRHDRELSTMSLERIQRDAIKAGRALRWLHDAMRALDPVAPKTWVVCHAVLKETFEALELLSQLEYVFQNTSEPKRTLEFERIRQVLVRVVGGFNERPLLWALRKAIATECRIDLSNWGRPTERELGFEPAVEPKNPGGRPPLGQSRDAAQQEKDRVKLAAYGRINALRKAGKADADILTELKLEKDFRDMLSPHGITVNPKLIDAARKHGGKNSAS